MERQQDAIDDFIQRAQQLYNARNPLLFTEEERKLIRDDLARSTLIREWNPKRRPSWDPSSRDLEIRGLSLSAEYESVRDLITRLIRDAVTKRRRDRTLRLVPDTRMTGPQPRSLAGELYLLILREMGLILDRDIWTRDDVTAMEELLTHALETTYTTSWLPNPPPPHFAQIVRAWFRVSDHLYGDRVDLLRRATSVEVDWRQVASEVVSELLTRADLSADEMVEVLLDAVEEAVQTRETARFGPESRVGREAVDDGERRAGQLSPTCDFWTYEELEHFARWLLRSLTDEQLYEFVRVHPGEGQSPMPPLGRGVPLPITPPGFDLRTWATTIVRRLPKRRLCHLLTTHGFVPPTIDKWTSQLWHNVDMLAGYLGSNERAELARSGDEGFFQSDGGRMLWRMRDPSGDRDYLQDTAESRGIRGLVLIDIQQKKWPVLPERGLSANNRHLRLLPDTEPTLIERDGYARVQHHALVVVRGRVVVGLVTANQRFDRARRLVLESETGTALLEPLRLELTEGDLLIVTFTERGDGYDLLTLRGVEDAEVVIYKYD